MITNIGKMYDLDDLRPFKLGLAQEGHPCALRAGNEIRLLRQADGRWVWDSWRQLQSGKPWWEYGGCDFQLLESRLRLAPLAIKDGRPLHIGDTIEEKIIMFGGTGGKQTLVNMQNWERLFYHGRWSGESK